MAFGVQGWEGERRLGAWMIVKGSKRIDECLMATLSGERGFKENNECSNA